MRTRFQYRSVYMFVLRCVNRFLYRPVNLFLEHRTENACAREGRRCAGREWDPVFRYRRCDHKYLV
jgi:hypothetical protein